MKLIPASKAIKEVWLDFGDGAKYAETYLAEVTGLSDSELYWKGTRLHFLTESILPTIKSPTRPRVMLLFSNPHPESVRKGLFMSEVHSRIFWEILRCNIQLGIKHNFRLDSTKDIDDTVSLLLNGDYGNDRSPLLFLECFYQIPSKSPEILRKLFANADDFKGYLHNVSLDRVRNILINSKIDFVLVFKGKTFEDILNKPGISKYSRQTLSCAVESALDKGDERVFWEFMKAHKLIEQVPNLKHECIAVKVMDTRIKNSIFSHALDYSLQHATKVV
ncbi:hypothetical protein ACFLXJ_00545 [Chloroflexota bacterium]